MNKGIATFLVLFFTTVTMGFMMCFVNLRYNQERLEINREVKKNKEVSDNLYINEVKDKESIEEQEKGFDKNEEGNVKKNDIENEEVNLNDNHLEEELKKEIKKPIKINEKKEKPKEKVELDEGLGESKQVFKVDKHSIPKKIANGDKFKLIAIAKNLSLTDYGILLEHIKRSDELDAAIDILKLLKDRLNEKEYSEMKDILSPYINIELIEESI